MKNIDVRFNDIKPIKRLEISAIKKTTKTIKKMGNWNVFEVLLYLIAILIMVLVIIGFRNGQQIQEESVEVSEGQNLGELLPSEENLGEENTLPPSDAVEVVDETATEKDSVQVTAEVKKDDRVTQVFNFLIDYGSPIPEVSSTIVEASDYWGVDPYVVTAIFCQESSCGKACHEGNCTGYGLGDSATYGEVSFDSEHTGMNVMIQRFATDWGGAYKACGHDFRCISNVGYNSSESWIQNVTWFYNKIKTF